MPISKSSIDSTFFLEPLQLVEAGDS